MSKILYLKICHLFIISILIMGCNDIISDISPPYIVNGPEVGPDPFSPDDNGIEDETRIRAKFSERIEWVFEIRDGDNIPIWSLSGDSSRVDIIWDGRDFNDEIVPNGRYTFNIEGEDRNGDLLNPVIGSITVDRILKRFVNVSIYAGLRRGLPSYGNPVLGDIDNDGFIDIISPHHGANPSLYRNNGDGRFTNIFKYSGITRKADRHGLAMGDYDNDGNIDLYISIGGERGGAGSEKKDELWKGDGKGRFVYTGYGNFPNPAGRGRSASWIDYDNDGYLDLFVLNKIEISHKGSILYKNNRGVDFSDVTHGSGLEDTGGRNLSWADYDNDGYLDLLIVDNDEALLFKNKGNGTFTDTTSQAGLDRITNGRGIAWGDYNNDGNIDLYIVRGYNDLRNSLIIDNGKIIFLDEEREGSGIEFKTGGRNITFDLYLNNRQQPSKISIGGNKTNPVNLPFRLSSRDPSAEGDPDYIKGEDVGFYIWRKGERWSVYYSSDGRRNIFYGKIISDGDFIDVISTFDIRAPVMTDILYRNNGDGTFTDVSDETGILKRGGNHNSAIWGDYDNDGDLDLFVTDSGDISKNGSNLLYRNDNGVFEEVAEEEGIDGRKLAGRHNGVAWGDYNNDGALDLFLTNGIGSGYPLSKGDDILYRNSLTNNWIEIRLIRAKSNRSGIGTKIKVITGEIIQYREVNGGGGGDLHSQGSGPVHLGIGSYEVIDRIIVRWPEGKKEIVDNIQANQSITIIEK